MTNELAASFVDDIKQDVIPYSNLYQEYPDELNEALDIAANILRRTAEYDKLQAEGRLVVLPCKVGDDVFTMRWSLKNQKYEVFAGKVKNVRYDAIDSSVMVSDGEYYRKWGKDAFSSRQEAEAALGGGEGG